MFKWDEVEQAYSNAAIQGFFLLFIGGVTYGQETASKVSDEPNESE